MSSLDEQKKCMLEKIFANKAEEQGVFGAPMCPCCGRIIGRDKREFPVFNQAKNLPMPKRIKDGIQGGEKS